MTRRVLDWSLHTDTLTRLRSTHGSQRWRAIKSLVGRGYSMRSIATLFDLSAPRVRQIVIGPCPMDDAEEERRAMRGDWTNDLHADVLRLERIDRWAPRGAKMRQLMDLAIIVSGADAPSRDGCLQEIGYARCPERVRLRCPGRRPRDAATADGVGRARCS